jgi:hypothetical protein
VISLTLRFPTPYYLTLLLNSLRISCSFPLTSLLRGPPPPTFDRPTIEEDGGRKDGHGNVATSFGLGSPGNPIPSTETTKGIPNLNPGLRSTLSLLRIQMTYFHTIIPFLRVTADRAPDPCRPYFPTRARVPPAGQWWLSSRKESSRRLQGGESWRLRWIGDKRDIDLLLPTTVQSLEDSLCGDTPIEPVVVAPRNVIQQTTPQPR